MFRNLDCLHFSPTVLVIYEALSEALVSFCQTYRTRWYHVSLQESSVGACGSWHSF